MILILEDDPDRVARFAAVLAALAPGEAVRVWADANRFVAEAEPLLAGARLVSLDHDLETPPGGPDPGDGYAAAVWLASRSVAVPVIVHSSNSERARWMAGAFDLAGRRHRRVAPLGDDWIEADWRRAARRVLRRRGKSA